MFTGNNLLSPGQQVYLSGLSSTGNWNRLDGNQNVTAATTTTFTLVLTTATVFSGTTTGTGTPVSAPNPAIVNMAVLGNCPTSGVTNFGSSSTNPISFVYMNEVSTAAAAYAFSGFGSGPFNIGIPSSANAMQLKGIQNATNNAAQLYSIQGYYNSTTADGDGHIANPTTPAGNGVVPQSLLDTLGNIIASCVDSGNTVNSSSNPYVAGASPNCSTLFNYATSNGIPFGSSGAGTVATDTATAAFNIAHNPAGNPAYSSNFVSNIYNLQSSEVTPFTPDLTTQPNDFTVGIQYPAALNPGGGGTPSTVTGAEAVAVDGNGNFWFTADPTGAKTSGYLAEDSPLGVGLHNHYNSTFAYGDVAIDSSQNAWTGNQGAYVDATEDGPSTSYVTADRGSAFTYAQAALADNSTTSGDVFFPHGPTNPPPAANDNNQTVSMVTPSNVTTGTIGNMSASFSPGAYATHGAIDSNGYIWFTSNNGNLIARVGKNSGTAYTGFPVNTSTHTGTCNATSLLSPEQPAIDASGSAWVPVYNGGSGTSVLFVKPSATGATACTLYTTGAGPWAAAVDGANNVWVTNRSENTITELSAATGTAMSPSTNYTIGGLLYGPEGVAVDLSGDLIITNYTGNSIVEVIGAATPTYLPLGAAAGSSKLGAKP